MHRTLITPWKPGKAQILAARNKLIPDLAAKNLIVLFVGINPGLYTAAIGHHFGRPGNRFWPALYGGGFTPRLFSPFEDSLLLDLNFGITNIVERAPPARMNSPMTNFAPAASKSPFSATATLGFFPTPAASTPITCLPPSRTFSETSAFGPLQSTGAAKIEAKVVGTFPLGSAVYL